MLFQRRPCRPAQRPRPRRIAEPSAARSSAVTSNVGTPGRAYSPTTQTARLGPRLLEEHDIPLGGAGGAKEPAPRPTGRRAVTATEAIADQDERDLGP